MQAVDGNQRTVLIYLPIDGKYKTLSFDMKHQFRRVTRDSHCIARAGRRHLIFDSIVFRRGVQSVQSLWSFSHSSWNDRKLEIQIPLSSTACVTWGGSLQAAVCVSKQTKWLNCRETESGWYRLFAASTQNYLKTLQTCEWTKIRLHSANILLWGFVGSRLSDNFGRFRWFSSFRGYP